MPEATIDNSPKFDRRPWGTFSVLDEGDNYKVKRIEVLPGKRLSYQKHAQRAEHSAREGQRHADRAVQDAPPRRAGRFVQ